MRVHFIQHVSFENPGSLLQWAKNMGHQIHITRVFNEEPFPEPDQYDMLIVMGGPMGIYQEKKFKWMTAEKTCIEQAIHAAKKVMGICLGSQLIASVLGAGVYAHVQQEIGWWPIFPSNPHPLSQILPQPLHCFHWHGDTFDLPAHAVSLFHSDACTQQGFIYQNHVLALQFHPEIEMHLLLQMLQHGKHELINAPFVQTEHAIIKQTEKFLPQQYPFLIKLLNMFLKDQFE
ncbi:MAG: type 1 glutamine amidotransferase [Sphingobacteriales bacterium]|uniref:type 1 glutamine amidotransferase n=1 Tax=Hydrotalea flava TaxID=714549 RepID=UPI000835FA1D|nr:type 1 glutamine amidotransferase [Hydrotalea flava]RTL51501.1 MAG: type 1 glutamine amidotransferase [Sphingobacteriales bacterium]